MKHALVLFESTAQLAWPFVNANHEMGCAISKFHSRLSDFSKRANQVESAITINALNLHTYLSRDNPNPKCIFVFGGSGSNKGEFIWEMLRHSSENQQLTSNEDITAAKWLLGEEVFRPSGAKFAYHYIDVEKLIVDNLDKRIKKLSNNPQQPNQSSHFLNNYVQDNVELVNHSSNSLAHLSVDSPDIFVARSTKRRKSSQSEELKTQLLLYANIITHSWILSLIKKEIEDNNFGPHEKIFVINFVPNRINMFKDCLFLKQSPSFANFHFNYIVVNLVKHSARRKDLEIKTDDLFDEVNSNFINYFRIINKLIDVRIENGSGRLHFKLTTSKDAIKIENKDQLVSFIYMPKKDQLELNIFNFEFTQLGPAWEEKNSKSSITFLIGNQLQLDDSTWLRWEEKNIDLLHVRKFIKLYNFVLNSLNCL